jgi:subtilisin family serine protease
MFFLFAGWLFLFASCMDVPDPHEFVVRFKDPREDPQLYANTHHLRYLGPVTFLKGGGYHRFSQPQTTRQSGELADPHQKIAWMERQVPRQQHRRGVPSPSDPLFPRQWHLSHIQAKESWDVGFTGHSVTVAIVDDGVQHRHPDITPNYVAQYSHDFNRGTGDPSPGYGDFHGTCCAGVVGAMANNSHCGCGVAPKASIVGLRLIGAPTTDLTEATGLSHESQHIDIYSSSWGPRDDGMRMEGPGHILREALANNVQNGRGGKGNIYVWASGNGGHVGDSCSFDGYASSPYTIAVGAVNQQERQSYYSEGCPALMCVAPSSGKARASGIVTVDVNTANQGYSPNAECTARFGGTSSACPTVAGAIALVLQANPNLTWRDVQLLVAKTSKIVDPKDSGWSTNGRGYRHNERYGFGLIQARTMLEAARAWTNVPTQKGYSSGHIHTRLRIPRDGTPVCVSHTFSGSNISFVEHVLVRVGLHHPRRGQVRVRLRSPENVVSMLADVHPDPHANYPLRDGWLFTSVRHFGERSGDGDWHLCLEDGITDDYGNGVFDFWELAIFGH